MASIQTKHYFTDQEIKGIRVGLNGVKSTIPARFYYDEDIYKIEVEYVLKKQWLCIGRWDQVEKPGDYFTIRMWGESIVVVRDRKGILHALVNVCQHRWSQVVEDGSGNVNMFMCPYHHWTYNLDGTLRGISVRNIPGVDRKKCRMPELRVEEWHGFIFLNFDRNADPLAPQLEAVNSCFERFEVDKYRQMDAFTYQTTWNWKFTIETGYEGYHHVGLHHDRIYHIIPSSNTEPLYFGKACGSYKMWYADDVPGEVRRPFGAAPVKNGLPLDDIDRFIVIYPGLTMYLSNYQCTYIIIQHQSVDSNTASTCQAFAPWAIEAPGADEKIRALTEAMRGTQEEDSFGCSMLQKGVTSQTNAGSMIHPLEQQLNHYHQWYMSHFLPEKNYEVEVPDPK